MADLTVTATQVLAGVDADFYNGIAGGTITAGQAIYLDETVNQLKTADANASLVTANAKGISLHAATAGQPLRIQVSGSLTIGAGAAPTVGIVYVVSATAGGIAPAADLASGHYTTVLGVGGTTNTIKMSVFASNQVLA